ncbi:hypothetical protein K1719_039429 [Acacia pycnantha]|nr:hypothetical protein K1719_039429 [Acacia pycnantha]
MEHPLPLDCFLFSISNPDSRSTAPSPHPHRPGRVGYITYRSRICRCRHSCCTCPFFRHHHQFEKGFNVETVEYKNISFTIWDVGGQDKCLILVRLSDYAVKKGASLLGASKTIEATLSHLHLVFQNATDLFKKSTAEVEINYPEAEDQMH